MDNEQVNVISTKDWMITILISAIPLVGFIMLFVWSFGAGENPNKANWAKAALIWLAVVSVLTLIFWATIAAALLRVY